MKHIIPLSLIILLFFVTGTTASAQRKKAEQPDEAIVKLEEAKQMIAEYRFDAAIELLEAEVEKAKKKKKPFAQQDSLIQFAEVGSKMLAGTERVVFIDSVVADKRRVLAKLNLDEECGSLLDADALSKFVCDSTHRMGQTAYMNELNDEITLAHADKAGSKKKLAASVCIADEWSAPTPLPGISLRDEEQDYPFVLADGVTMYYAAKGEESFGGYDIFVTRYNPEAKTYFKPENIGMPFNSPANDYLYIIDERYDIGWFVSDRNQPEDKVCIYTFIPNATRRTYDTAALGEEAVQRAARIHAIAESQWNKTEVAKARQRIEELQRNRYALHLSHTERYVINDNVVYTSLSEFRSERAREFAAQCEKMHRALEQKQKHLDELRKRFGATSPRSAALAAEITSLEQEIVQQQEAIRFMEKTMRKEELGVLQQP